jgi:putative Ca2+/H+ antiporter (TMEM165/GDT1 family)
MLDLSLFASTFALIFMAELPDKTAFATLLLATRGNPWAIFIGVASAFLVQSAVAVTFGSILSALPEQWVHRGAGVLFLIFAYLMWTRKEEDDETEERESVSKHSAPSSRFWQNVQSSFVVIFIAEWGDLTQLATASLAARYRAPLTIFLAATLSLWCVTAIAITVGNRAKHLIRPGLIKKIAALAFMGVGIYFLVL